MSTLFVDTLRLHTKYPSVERLSNIRVLEKLPKINRVITPLQQQRIFYHLSAGTISFDSV